MRPKQFTQRDKDIGIEYALGNFGNIVKAVKEYGIAFVQTGDDGGINASWNLSVAQSIYKKSGIRVVCSARSPFHDSRTVYVYQRPGEDLLNFKNRDMKHYLESAY